MTATESGDDGHLAVDFGTDDLFQLQHHHLLNCLEHTTVSCSISRIFVLVSRSWFPATTFLQIMDDCDLRYYSESFISLSLPKSQISH